MMGEPDYLEKKKFSFWGNTYLKKDKDFSGMIFYHTVNGEFVNGWQMENSQVIGKIRRKLSGENLPVSFGRTAATTCTTYDVYTYYEQCTDWYTSGEEYIDTTCQYSSQWTDSYEVCETTEEPDNSGNSGGGSNYSGPTPMESEYIFGSPQMKLCASSMQFNHIGNSFTAEVDDLGLSVWNDYAGLPVVNVELGTVCISLPDYDVPDAVSAADYFSQMFNWSRERVDLAIQLGEIPVTNTSVRTLFLETLRGELDNFFSGSSFSTGPCRGNISSSTANYDINC